MGWPEFANSSDSTGSRFRRRGRRSAYVVNRPSWRQMNRTFEEKRKPICLSFRLSLPDYLSSTFTLSGPNALRDLCCASS